MNLIKRALGGMYGLAIGDSLGAAVEWKTREYLKEFPVVDLMPSKTHRLDIGQFTDDTSMALCLADSLVKDGFNPKSQIENYIKWKNEGLYGGQNRCVGIGGTTSYSLDEYLEHLNPIGAENNPHRAGNGSIMRLFPVPLYHRHNFTECVKNSGISSLTTHGADEAVYCSMLLGGILYKAINGFDKQSILLNEDTMNTVNTILSKNIMSEKILSLFNANYLDKNIDEIHGNAYSVDSLEASLWVFANTNSYEEAVLMAVNLGDDADTTGAIVGQLAGCFYGIDNIPEKWLKTIDMYDTIHELTMNLIKIGV